MPSVCRGYAMDANGNRVGTSDAAGIVTFDEYDALDRHTVHGIVRNGQRVIQQVNQYDQAGRLYAEIEGAASQEETLASVAQGNYQSVVTGVAGNTRFSLFDERGNIVATRNESKIEKTFVFNEANRKVKEIDGLGNSLTWTYNEGDYGRLVSHKDLGNRNFSYVYNGFGQVTAENSDKTYLYYGNGLLKSIVITSGQQRSFQSSYAEYNEQWQHIKTSTYSYDLQGNKVNDVLASYINWSTDVGGNRSGDGSTRQETRYRFDEAGRLANANALAGSFAYGTGTFNFIEGFSDDGYGYGYGYGDSNNFHYSLGNTTYINLSYQFDEYGNRRRSKMESAQPNGWQANVDNWFKYDLADRAVVVDGYLDNGAIVANALQGYTLSYDAAGRRTGTERWIQDYWGQAVYERYEYTYNDQNQVASRTIRHLYRSSWANSNAAVQSTSAVYLDQLNSYDDRGRVISQTSYKEGVAQSTAYSRYRGDNQKISELTYGYSYGVEYLAQGNYFGEAGMFDAAGNQTRYRFATFNTSGVATQAGDYSTVYAGFETYKALQLTATASGMDPGVTSYVYSDRGDLLHLSSGLKGTFRRFAVDGESRMIGVEDAYTGRAQIYLGYQNAALANAGGLSIATISNTLEAISDNYPAQAPSSYVVNQGDTLESIAQTVWGDRSMWYLIADANGKDLSEALVAGSSLKIPNVVSSNRNDATTFKPYNPNEVIGDVITPPQPPKPKKKKCNAVASVVMVVVAVVATVLTAGAAAPLLGGVATSMGLSVAGTAIASAVTAVSWGIGAAVGSLASQAVGKAMGVVDHISWKQAAVAGLTAGVASWAAPALGAVQSATGSTMLRYAAQGALVYGTNYVGSKIVGLDTSFSWKNMAASAIASAVAGELYADDGFMGSVIRGQASAHTSAWMRDKWFGGGRPDYGQVAVDAFGNALADYIVGEISTQAKDKKQTKDKKQVLDDLKHWVDKPKIGEGVNPFHSASDSARDFNSQLQLASNGSAVPVSRSDVAGVVDPGAVAEYRESGWFNVVSQLTEDEYFGLKYVRGSGGGLSSYSDVPTLPEVDPATGKYVLSPKPQWSLGGRLEEFYNDYSIIPYIASNGDRGHDSLAEVINLVSGVMSGGRLALGAVDEALIWAGLGGIDRLPLVGGAPQVVVRAETMALKQFGSAIGDGGSAAVMLPLVLRARKVDEKVLETVTLSTERAETAEKLIKAEEALVVKTYSGSIHDIEFVGPFPRDMGPVWIKPMPGMTQVELDQINAYIKLSNDAVLAGVLSPTGRVSTKGALRFDASRQAMQERKAGLLAGTPYVGHVGHVPDTTWMGTPTPYAWLDLSPRVNMSLGGQAGGYPLGYKPTIFVFDGGLP